MSPWSFFIVCLVLIAFGLSGCVNASDYAAAAEQKAKEAKNIEAALLEDAPCLVGLGAWARMDDIRKRMGMFYLCVPDAERFGVEMQ